MNKCLLLFSLFTLLPTSKAVSFTNSVDVKNISEYGFDFYNGVYCFKLNERFYDTPNAISASVRLGYLDYYEKGGAIFGSGGPGAKNGIALQVNSSHQIEILWDNQSLITFENYILPSHEWKFVTVTRDENCSKFSLYIDGYFKEEKEIFTKKNLDLTYKFYVGSDNSHNSVAKQPFKGEIRQVTVYSKPLDGNDILKDYLQGSNISYLNRDNLLFNAYLDQDSDFLLDTSKFKNNAAKWSCDYYYDGEYYDVGDYTFVAIPDPQIIPEVHESLLHYQADWILENYEARKINNVMVLGDNTNLNDLAKDYEYKIVMEQYERLNGKVPWTTIPGNHDYDNQCKTDKSLTKYNKAFSYEKLSTYTYFGGVFEQNHTENAYWFIEGGGVKWLLLTLEFGPGDDVLEWANQVVSNYPDRRVIVTTHSYLGADGEPQVRYQEGAASSYGFVKNVSINDADLMWEKFLRKHKNIFMVIGGHIICDDIMLHFNVGDYGNVVTEMLVDTQELTKGHLDLIVSLLSFDELKQEIRFNTVSTISNKFWNLQNQFVLSFKGFTDILSTQYYEPNGNLKPQYTSLININNSQNDNNWYFEILSLLVIPISVTPLILVRKRRYGKAK